MTKTQTQMDSHSSTYADKVFRFLQNGKIGASYTIDRICTKENQPQFIELVKEFMRITPWQGGWEFNSSNTKIRRIKLEFNNATLNRGIYE